jgi:hypothetical protein
MSETIGAGTLQLAVLATLALAILMLVRLRRRVAARQISPGKAVLKYLGWTLTPLVLLVATFFALIGIEELSSGALIPETFARASPLAAGLCLLIVIVMTIVLAVVAWRARPAAEEPIDPER